MTSYDLESVSLPVLSGASLKAMVWALETRATRAMLLGKLFKDGGITKLREMTVDESPTFLPLAPPVADAPASGSEPEAGPKIEGAGKTVRDFARAYRSGETTPLAVAERFLEARAEAEKGERPLSLFIACDEEDVRNQARASTERFERGEPRSIFEGVPVAVKDELDQFPYPSTVGTSFLGSAPAQADATIVGRLRAAGALLVGKSNMYEIGINPNGQNVHYGQCRNPYHSGHDTGGSSSGSAAIVAAGLCPLALGADGGGSIRIPAALCGVVGLKATFGRISEHGAAPLCWSVAHLGPLGATVEDVVLAYQVIAGPDPLDVSSLHQPPVALSGWQQTDLSGLTVGVFRPWFEHAAEEVVAACNVALEVLQAKGAQIREIEIPGLDAIRIAHAILILSEMAISMDSHREHARSFAPAVRINLALGRCLTSGDYVKAQKIRTRAQKTFARVFEDVQIVITPTTATTAPPIREETVQSGCSDLSATTEIMRYASPGNLVGLPALSVPVSYGAKGLPIGLQIMGRHWEELTLFRVAHAVEQETTRQLAPKRFDVL